MKDGVLILGGAGFLGSHLARHLIAQGEQHVAILDIADRPVIQVQGATYHHHDLRQPIPSALGTGVTTIFNLAAVHRTPGHPDLDYYRTNILGAAHACDLARRVGVASMVFTSSISVYGPSEQRLDETAPLAPISAYGRSKAIAEDIHRQWAAQDPNRRLIIARPAALFGPGEGGNFTRLARAIKAGRFVYPGRRDTIKACLYVQDAVAALMLLLDRAKDGGTFNLAFPDPLRLDAIANAMARLYGVAPPRWTVPLPAMHAAAWGFEILANLGVETGINRARIDKLVTSTDIAPQALSALGFRPRHDLASALEAWRNEAGDLV